ncbi:hypothetical protein M430DRAFT_31252 [Amorphotheca resinae ATCC 22711]|uniref:SET domain-containing protein n=1 Tax=Amorphotheca resinae ATCC 22711 TaxID=857342 RepID=A0A2T3AQI9_AMORE|nr:hypothetical protein M430DRAFT_31252 [Amorphotheca resinae ATCC 22711]PSS08528.1 hypothetical protein M430DRAFT_31252 [Amorphotheca resinae ATCC 22711]
MDHGERSVDVVPKPSQPAPKGPKARSGLELAGRVAQLAARSPRQTPPPRDIGAMAPAPPTPPPEDLKPVPLRYPETLGTLIEIRESEGKGKGVFALTDIEPGTILLSEAPLVTLIDTGTRADPLDAAVNALSPEARASYLSLHSYSSRPHESRNRSILYSNGYSIMNDLATGVFETASRINHSCVPNSLYKWFPQGDSGRMVFWNRFKLLEGEEVCVDYGHKRSYLKRFYGFDCDCGGCTDGGGSNTSSSSSENEKAAESGVKGIEEVMKSLALDGGDRKKGGDGKEES